MKASDLAIGKCYNISYRRQTPLQSWLYTHEVPLRGAGYLVNIDDPSPGWHTFRLKSTSKIVYSSSRGVIGELATGAIFTVPGPSMWSVHEPVSSEDRKAEADIVATFLDGLGVSCSIDSDDAMTIPYESLLRFKMVIATLYKKILLENNEEEGRAMSKDIPTRLEELKSRFINEATSKQMVDEMDEIIAELRATSNEARKDYRVDL